jgi:alkylation response protein AidB-like acyl-CoA dehydrogenase
MQNIQSILKGIDGLKDELSKRAAEMEEARLLPADLAAKMAKTGVFRLLTPKSIGGPELSAHEFIECLERLALSNASAAWCAMIGSTTALNAAYFPKDIAKEIYGDPDVITGGVFAPMGKAVIDGDSYRVSGRWSWGSGSANCTWIAGGCTIWQDGDMLRLPSGALDTRMILFPASDVILHDTWHVMGLKGTGSGDFEVKDCLVPKERSVSLISDKPLEDGAAYKFPIFGLLSLGK